MDDNVKADRCRLDPDQGTRADRAIRLSTAGAVLAVAGVAAYISYWHAYAVVCQYGETGITARLEPATIDGLVYACSMVMLYAAWITPGTLEALIPGRMQSHGGTEEVPG